MRQSKGGLVKGSVGRGPAHERKLEATGRERRKQLGLSVSVLFARLSPSSQLTPHHRHSGSQCWPTWAALRRQRRLGTTESKSPKEKLDAEANTVVAIPGRPDARHAGGLRSGDRTMVMYVGHTVEAAESSELMQQPAHPYTPMLLAAVPNPQAGLASREEAARGNVPSLIDLPPGCPSRTAATMSWTSAARRCRGPSRSGRATGSSATSTGRARRRPLPRTEEMQPMITRTIARAAGRE
jgi:oligopeptide/dipeptide ABC transporter ATP-binding protein